MDFPTMDNGLLDIVGDIYDCAIEPERWPPTLKRIVDYVGADCAWLNFYDIHKAHLGWGAAWGLDPRAQRSYDGRLHAINPMLSAGWFADVYEPYTAHGLMGDEFFSTRFYKEWVAPNGWQDAAVTVLTKAPTRVTALTLPRHAGRAQFTPDDMGRVRLLAPHLSRSVTIAYMLDDRALRDDMLSATLDLLIVGIVLVDSEARIVHANRAGARHLDEAQSVRRSDDRLSARDPVAAAALRDAIMRATRAGATLEVAKTGIAVPITGVDGRDLAAWVLPLDGGLRNEFASAFRAKVAVFLRELGDTAPLPGELFVRRYGITPAECRVLMLLAQGMSPHETADALGCSEPTVRTHMQRLFTKTGTSGQPDLMRLAMSALAPASR
jgi:DNA-binding CsgD family transcriptional regulator